MFTIDNAMKKCKTKEEFIDEMKKNGYEVLWTDARKYITYTCPNRMKCRDIKLHQEKYRKEKMELEFELRRIETEKCTAESYSQRYDSKDGTGITSNNRGERLLESTDKSEQNTKSAVEYNRAESSGRENNQSLFGTNYSSTEKENDGARKYNSETAEELGNGTDRTGWEDERGYAFGRKREKRPVGQTEKEMDSDILWNDDRYSSVLSYTLYFAGDLFKMINNQTKYHRKRIKLSQKEIEKRLAHGQKSDGYEEYEDYYNNQLTM